MDRVNPMKMAKEAEDILELIDKRLTNRDLQIYNLESRNDKLQAEIERLKKQLKTQLESAEKVIMAANEMEKILASVWRECDTTALRDGEKHVSFTIESRGNNE